MSACGLYSSISSCLGNYYAATFERRDNKKSELERGLSDQQIKKGRQEVG